MCDGPWMHQINQMWTRERVAKEDAILERSFLASLKMDEEALNVGRHKYAEKTSEPPFAYNTIPTKGLSPSSSQLPTTVDLCSLYNRNTTYQQTFRPFEQPVASRRAGRDNSKHRSSTSHEARRDVDSRDRPLVSGSEQSRTASLASASLASFPKMKSAVPSTKWDAPLP
eukprot:CAMPEP_0198200740 /NCGR_PEP_ID=MMETSP1445-20131203/3702_1 /TAXON_ID=36898 /ORGANISM="Pyramimonas sp., Strain CCMP2087" /LENGTH=169 /DNA_ID=CAMNT_0043870885 /DNA_START=141 /DNA_END=646 /DNA_ORIENTATION=+